MRALKPVADWLHVTLIFTPLMQTSFTILLSHAGLQFQAGLLENVLGIKDVLEEVCRHLLEMLPEYELHTTILDPCFGCKASHVPAAICTLKLCNNMSATKVQLWAGRHP